MNKILLTNKQIENFNGNRIISFKRDNIIINIETKENILSLHDITCDKPEIIASNTISKIVRVNLIDDLLRDQSNFIIKRKRFYKGVIYIDNKPKYLLNKKELDFVLFQLKGE